MPRRNRLLLVAAIAAAWSLWLGWSHVAHGPDSYYRQHDTAEANGAFFVGQAAYASADLLGAWAPGALAGVDAQAAGRGVQPLFEAVYRLAPYWWTTGVVAIGQTFIAAFFMVVLLQRRLGVSIRLALLAGLFFSMMYNGLGAHAGFFLPKGLLESGLPLLLLGLASTAERRMPVVVGGAAFGGIIVGISAHPIVGMLVLPVVAWWMFVVERGGAVRHVATFVVFALSFGIVIAPMFMSMAVHAADAHRTLWATIGIDAAADSERWMARRHETDLWFRSVAPMLIPAVTGWIAGGFRRRSLNALLGLSVGLLALKWSMVPIQGLLQKVAPAFASFQVDSMIDFLPFLTAAAGAIGLQQLLTLLASVQGKYVKAVGLAVLSVGVLMIAAEMVDRALMMNRGREHLRQRASSYGGMLGQSTLAKLAHQMRIEPPARIVTLADRNEQFSGQHPGFAWAHGLETADGYLNLYPLRYHTFWSWVVKPAFELRPDLLQYFVEWGNRLYLFNPFHGRTASGPIQVRSIANLELLALANVRYLVTPVAVEDPDLVLWPGNEGNPTSEVQWRLTETGANVKALFVYENRLWLPRFFVATQMRTFAKADELLAAMAESSVDELRTTAFFMQRDSAGQALPVDGAEEAISAVDVRRYSADRIELEVRTDVPGTLVVSNSYSRFWRVHVNDVPGVVTPVNFSFQGVHVPAGASRVHLEYAPPYAVPLWQRGLAVTLLASLIVALWTGVTGRTPGMGHSARTRFAVGLTCIVVGVLVVSMRQRPVTHAWADGDVPHRLPLTMRAMGFSTPVDFPVLVERGPDDVDFWRVAPRSATDIWFTDGHGRLVPHETERFDPVARRLSIWLQVPEFGWGERTMFMYFGAPPSAVADRAAEVWNRHYIAVWHLDSPVPDAILRDSTSGAHHARLDDGTHEPRQAEGRIAGGVAMGGTDRLIVEGSDIWTFGEDEWAIEFWLNPAPLEGRNFGIIDRGPGGLFQLYLHRENFFVLERSSEGRARDHSFAGTGLEPGAWSHVSLARRGGRLLLHVNGELRDVFDSQADFAYGPSPFPATLGWGPYGGLVGTIDEVRISRGRPKPPGWSRAVYLSQTDSRFVRYGAVEHRVVR